MINFQPAQVTLGVFVYNICDWLDAEFGADMDYFGMDIEIVNERFRQFCEANGFHYYARPRESFSIHEAICETKLFGKTKVIVEDLS